MPNVGVEVRRGVLCVAGAAGAGGAGDAGDCSATWSSCPTTQFDAATAVMGCAPAYLALAVEAIADAGAADGLDEELARELVVETTAGTAELLRVRHPADVRKAVASPGGSTEAGLEALDREGAREAFEAAVRASLERMRGMIPLALTRGDVADYVSALFLVYIILIFAQHPDLLDAADALQPAAAGDPRLRQRDDRPLPELLPPLPAAGRRRRLRARPQPDVGIIVLFVAQAIVVGLIEG